MSDATNPSQNIPDPSKSSLAPLRIKAGRAELLGAAIGIGILGFIIALPLFYFKSGIRDWGKLLGLSAGVAVFTGFIARSRAGGKEKTVVVSEESVTIENEKERLEMPWGEIERVNHWLHGGDYWEFVSSHRSHRVVLKGLGFSKEQCNQLSERFRLHKPFVEEEVGSKRMLEDAFVH